MFNTITIRSICFYMVLTVGMFWPCAAYSCGACVDYQLDWYLPFIKPLFLIFSGWILFRFVFWIIGKATSKSIPLTFSKRPWLYNIGVVVIAIAVSMLSMGSVLLPFILVIVPACALAIYRSQRRFYSFRERGKLQSLFIYFQWATLIIAGFIVIHSIARFNSTDRLIRKLAYNSILTMPAQQRLILKGKEIYPDVIPIVTNFNANNLRERNQYINLMNVIREIGEESISPMIAAKFRNIMYIDGLDGLYMDDVFISSAKTLTALDKKIASETILQKLKDLREIEMMNSYEYQKIVDGLIESVADIDTQTLISAYIILGSPDFGSDIGSYKEWWRNRGKNSSRK
jgi:hypothetical protein